MNTYIYIYIIIYAGVRTESASITLTLIESFDVLAQTFNVEGNFINTNNISAGLKWERLPSVLDSEHTVRLQAHLQV